MGASSAAARQMQKLNYYHTFTHKSHGPAIELAEKVAGYAPGDLDHVFFTSGGGEAVETAWKLAKNYFKLTGKPMKHKVISRAVASSDCTSAAADVAALPRCLQRTVRLGGAASLRRAARRRSLTVWTDLSSSRAIDFASWPRRIRRSACFSFSVSASIPSCIIAFV